MYCGDEADCLEASEEVQSPVHETRRICVATQTPTFSTLPHRHASLSKPQIEPPQSFSRAPLTLMDYPDAAGEPASGRTAGESHIVHPAVQCIHHLSSQIDSYISALVDDGHLWLLTDPSLTTPLPEFNVSFGDSIRT